MRREHRLKITNILRALCLFFGGFCLETVCMMYKRRMFFKRKKKVWIVLSRFNHEINHKVQTNILCSLDLIIVLQSRSPADPLCSTGTGHHFLSSVF